MDNTIPVIDCAGFYASHWGLTDLYPENEKTLKEWLASGKDFTTTWWGSKKEIMSAKYEAEGDTLTVSVCQSIDDMWESDDLIYDAICGLNLNWEPSKEAIEAIRDEAIEWGIEDSATASVTIPRNSSYEEVMFAVIEAEDETGRILHEGYKDLKTIVQGYYDYYNNKEETK